MYILTFLDVLHLRAALANKVTVQRILRALRQGASLRRVIHHNVVDGRLRFPNRFSGLVNRDLVFLGRLRVLGQIQFLLPDIRDDLATSIGDIAVTQDQLLRYPAPSNSAT